MKFNDFFNFIFLGKFPPPCLLCGGHTFPIMAPVWDQTAVRHENCKNRINVLNDLECPIILWTQSYTFVTESYWSGKVLRGRPRTPDSKCLLKTIGKLSRICLVWSLSDHIRDNRDTVWTDSVFFYHAEDTNQIRFGLKTGDSGLIRLKTISECCHH